MINFLNYNCVLWDFDGVLMDSMPVRDRGFEIVLSCYPNSEVEQLLCFHRQNGGISRYVKFRYFFEQIRNQPIGEGEIQQFAEKFSQVMKRELVNKDLLINESVRFVKTHYKKFNMHIVSGSDEKELQYLCSELGLAEYFISIHGSPTPKKDLVSRVLVKYNYDPCKVVFIGDSGNDWEAASAQLIDFMGYNNKSLSGIGVGYIDSFDNVQVNL